MTALIPATSSSSGSGGRPIRFFGRSCRRRVTVARLRGIAAGRQLRLLLPTPAILANAKNDTGRCGTKKLCCLRLCIGTRWLVADGQLLRAIHSIPR
jgi:hypothetical protein